MTGKALGRAQSARAVPERTPEARTRRSQRVVPLKPLRVESPDGKVAFTLLSSAERLGFQVTREDVVVLEPSPLSFRLDGFDLSSGVVLTNVERYEIQETYPWFGDFSTATNRCHGARLAWQHDLSCVTYVLEVRVFNDGVAYRHVIPGDADAPRTPDEYSTFIVPSGATVWYAGLAAGHYEDT